MPATSEEVVRSRLSLMDLLNPASDSESEQDAEADESHEDIDMEPEIDSHTIDPREVETMSVDDRLETAFGDQMVIYQIDGGVPEVETKSDLSQQASNLGGSLKQNCGPTKQISLASFLHLPSASTAKKRCASSLSDINDITSQDREDDRKRPRAEGKSKSAKSSRALRERFRKGELEVDETQLKRWRKKIINEDPNAEFDGKNTFAVRHSKCGDFINAKEPYDATRFREHIKQCTEETRKRRPASGVPSLLKMGWSKIKPSGVKAAKIVVNASDKPLEETYPCPGLTELDNSQIPVYLRRTGFIGGGARSLAVIAQEKFDKLFSKLSRKNKKEVIDVQLHEHRWRNEHDKCRVSATKCKHIVAEPASNERPLPCKACQSLLLDKRFKAILRRPVPDDKNFIYTNHRYRSKGLGEIYARTIGLKEIVEAPVSRYINFKIFIVY